MPVCDGQAQVVCPYCDTNVLVHNNNEYIYRRIDEAQLQRAETDRLVRLKELEAADKKAATRKIGILLWLGISGFLLILSILLMSFSISFVTGLLFLFYLFFPVSIGGGILLFKVIPNKEMEKSLLSQGAIRFPKNLVPFQGKHYDTVLSALKIAGFTNINCINLHDISFGIFQKVGKIESVSVNGKEITSGGAVYLPDVPIVITYHGK